MYKNIVLSGGSSKGFSYIGILKSLEEHKIKLNNFLGTSIGAIFATLFSMGFTYDELILYMNKSIEIIDINIENIFENYGICSGIEIINFVEEIIEKKYRKDITFKELNFLCNKKLIICVTDLNIHKIEYLSYVNYPDMKVVDAIRYAITIPYIFTIKKYKNKVFMDAGLIQNISFYDFNPKETLSVLLTDKTDYEKNEIDSLENYTKNLFICLKKNYINKVDDIRFKIINIICEGIKLLDFELELEKKQYLVKNGYDSINDFLKKIK